MRIISDCLCFSLVVVIQLLFFFVIVYTYFSSTSLSTYSFFLLIVFACVFPSFLCKCSLLYVFAFFFSLLFSLFLFIVSTCLFFLVVFKFSLVYVSLFFSLSSSSCVCFFLILSLFLFVVSTFFIFLHHICVLLSFKCPSAPFPPRRVCLLSLSSLSQGRVIVNLFVMSPDVLPSHSYLCMAWEVRGRRQQQGV